MKNVLLFLLSILVPTIAFGGVDLPVAMLTNEVHNSSEVGKIQVEGVGEVSLFARKNGKQIVIQAQDTNGISIGKAETVVGLKETPIFVTTPQGLQKIIILWGAKKP